MSKLRGYLIAGLLVWVPLGVTILIIKFLIDLMDSTLLILPAAWHPDQWLGMRVPGLGLLLSLVVVLVTGMIVANLFGRHVFSLTERALARIPVVRAIYSATKQLTETLFSGSGKSFRKVVLVQYPRVGLWTLGFITGDGLPEASRKAKRDFVNIFVPTTPNPTSGFFLMVPREDLVELEMSVDAGIKLIISAGAVLPDQAPAAVASPDAPRRRTRRQA